MIFLDAGSVGAPKFNVKDVVCEKKVEIFDTTLRDGSQSSLIHLSIKDKLEIAQHLDRLGVDYIEGGWPNPKKMDDLEFFKKAKSLGLKAQLAVFGSTCLAKNRMQVENDKFFKCLLKADTAIVVIFGKSWDLHVKKVLKVRLKDNLDMIERSVRFLKSCGKKVFYDAEHFFDGYKANRVYAIQTIRAAIKGGADKIVLCDTNGGTLTHELGNIILEVKPTLKVPWGIHCHNDSGVAVANSLEAVRLGATQVQVTLNGYGERCGNTNLCEIAPNLLKMGNKISVDREKIKNLTEISRLVAEIVNVPLAENAPYTGSYAFHHKAGTHSDGVSKVHESFEHVPPDSVGNSRGYLLSTQAGRATVCEVLKELGFGFAKNNPIVSRVLKKLEEKEKEGIAFETAYGSFYLLALKAMGKFKAPFTVRDKDWKINIDGGKLVPSILKVKIDGRAKKELVAAEGDGPIDSFTHALRKALEVDFPVVSSIKLTDYKVRILNGNKGTAARTRVLINWEREGLVTQTMGVSTNIIKASVIAIVNAFVFFILKG